MKLGRSRKFYGRVKAQEDEMLREAGDWPFLSKLSTRSIRSHLVWLNSLALLGRPDALPLGAIGSCKGCMMYGCMTSPGLSGAEKNPSPVFFSSCLRKAILSSPKLQPTKRASSSFANLFLTNGVNPRESSRRYHPPRDGALVGFLSPAAQHEWCDPSQGARLPLWSYIAKKRHLATR